MEIQSLIVKEKLKISGKTKTELLQAIANLLRLNVDGQYNDRIASYRAALEAFRSTPGLVSRYQAAPQEVAAIMLFNKDRRFTLTE